MYIYGGNRVAFEELEVGDVVVYHAFGGEVRRVAITRLDDDIKNSRNGFSGVIVDSNNREVPMVSAVGATGVWGYTSQILWHTGDTVVFDEEGNITTA